MVGLENVGSFTIVVLGVLLTTAFLKIFTTLTLLRCGIGINQWEGGLMVICLSLALTFFVMEPIIPLRTFSESMESFPAKISPFLRTHADSEIYQRLSLLRKSSKDSNDDQIRKEREPEPQNAALSSAEVLDVAKPGTVVRPVDDASKDAVSDQLRKNDVSPDDFSLLVASFMISQLRDAFEIGFVLLIPFLVLDLLIMNALMVLGARSVSVELISVPLKILLFFSVDGWTLISEKLLKEFM